MLLHSLKLHHIRSFIDADIQFPQQSTLLIGDIGSGKSTILLSIEFALFGLLRGELPGSALLRHGTRQGSVELHCTLDKKDVIIKRGLKRSKDTVVQDTGFIMIDSVKTEGTPVELKSKILELLGYPPEYLTRAKSLLYRYTVYTPQEEMKAILFESPEDRLTTIRNIFDIDKYQRMRDNLSTYLKELRVRKRLLESALEFLPKRKADLDQKQARHKELQEQITSTTKQHAALQAQRKAKEEELRTLEQAQQAWEKHQQALAFAQQRQREQQDRIQHLLADQERTKKLQQHYQEKLDKLKVSNNLEALGKALQKAFQEAQEAKDQALSILHKHQAALQASRNIDSKLSTLTTCPLCLQDVDHDHKKAILDKEHAAQEQAEQAIKTAKAQLKTTEDRLQELETKRANLQKLEAHAHQADLLNASLEQAAQQVLQFQKQKSDLEQALRTTQEEIARLSRQQPPEGQDQYQAKRKEFQGLDLEERSLAEQLAADRKEAEVLATAMQSLEQELTGLKQQQQDLDRIQQQYAWLDTFLSNALIQMERHVLSAVHQEFSGTFQEWFNILLEDDALTVRLDETFSPIIEQNGYETLITQLSGGEKTSVALAYRLSLHRVVNDFHGLLKTKDLIILDEPTDGFSTEQLDKMRDVLRKLKVGQSLLVSHEQQMEGFVDHIIRVVKQDHASMVIPSS